MKLPRIIPMSESRRAFWELGLCLTKVLLLIAFHFSTTVNLSSTSLRLFAWCCTRFCLCIPLDFPHLTSCLSSVFHCLLSVVCPRSLVVCGWVSGVGYQSFVVRGLSFKVHCSVHLLMPLTSFQPHCSLPRPSSFSSVVFLTLVLCTVMPFCVVLHPILCLSILLNFLVPPLTLKPVIRPVLLPQSLRSSSASLHLFAWGCTLSCIVCTPDLLALPSS